MRIAAASGAYIFDSTSLTRAGSMVFAATCTFVLPISAAISSIMATIDLIASCPASRAFTMTSSPTSFAPASTITRLSLLPATTMSSVETLRCA